MILLWFRSDLVEVLWVVPFLWALVLNDSAASSSKILLEHIEVYVLMVLLMRARLT